MIPLSHSSEIAANLERAEQSLLAARQLASGGYDDFAASRAYYAATAALLAEGIEFSKHTGVISFIHKQFVKTGRLSNEQGKTLNWLFELRGIGDYGGMVHVSPEQVEAALQSAEEFVAAIRSLLKPDRDSSQSDELEHRQG